MPPQEKNKSTKSSNEKKNPDAEVVSLSKGKTKITRFSKLFIFISYQVCYLPEDGSKIAGISKILKLIAFWYGRPIKTCLVTLLASSA